jgi:hypothetical protein
MHKKIRIYLPFLSGDALFCHFGDSGWPRLPRLPRVTVAAAVCHCRE